MNSLLRTTLALLLPVLIGACAQTQVVTLYEGDGRDEEEIAVVELASHLEIFSINDEEMEIDSPMFGTGERELHLEPGRYRILAFYRELREERTGGHRTLMSDAVEFPVKAQAGERYRLDYERPGNMREAEALAENFRGWVEHVGSGERTDTGKRVELQRGMLASSRPSARDRSVAPEPEAVAPDRDTEEEVAEAETTGDTEGDDDEYLDLLKAYWSQATEEERRRFLRWISEP